MKSCKDYIDELAPAQRLAARIDKNAVIAAGAGSGKTRVLAARYLHLIVEKGLPPSEILALTFTKKAAAEMYGRIYDTLCNTSDPAAKIALENFHEARITTIDSFCHTIAKSACRRYGISPDFEINNNKATELAKNLALPFYLEQRNSPGIQHLLRSNTQQQIADGIFAHTMVKHSPISSPINFETLFENQAAEVSREFNKIGAEIISRIATLKGLSGGTGKVWIAIQDLLETAPEQPDENNHTDIIEVAEFLAKLTSLSFQGRITNETVLEAKEIIKDTKTGLYIDYLALSNFILNSEIIPQTYALLSEFQELFHREKRARSLMTFADVSCLAVDALREDTELRTAIKASISSIMIDEFQDDNELQRNLLFLFAEKDDRITEGIPSSTDLFPDKLFFVGDEKQSIYRFRGADVSVFRALAADFTNTDTPMLDTNYRTESPLINTFNQIFPSVFLNAALYTKATFPLYEATFATINSYRTTTGIKPEMKILLIRKDLFPKNDPAILSSYETEAAEVAARIQELVSIKTPVRAETGVRPCKWDDIAILFRSTTRQHLYEKELRARGIPYQTESLRGLFNDAPINDLYSILRLAVYPADIDAYAVLLRSPLVGLSDDAFTEAILSRTAIKNEVSVELFPLDLAEGFSPKDKERFILAKKLYEEIRLQADRIPAAELVSFLWYDAGYRQVLLRDPSLHYYMEIYDYFFELARQADLAGETLAVFLDRVSRLMTNKEKTNDLDIPVDRHGGVRLMTIHKSKGLEFPIVFLIDCGNPGKNSNNAEPVYWSDSSGLSINTGAPKEVPSASINWFYQKAKEEERLRTEAELRRLLYVAMTRAETCLYVSGVMSVTQKDSNPDEPQSNVENQNSEELENDSVSGPKETPEKELREYIAVYFDKKTAEAEKNNEPLKYRTFFDLLLKSWLPSSVEGATIEDIPPRRREPPSRERINLSPAFDWHESIPLAIYKAGKRLKFPATALRTLNVENEEKDNDRSRKPDYSSNVIADEIDRLLIKSDITPSEFGTWAHKTIEARFLGIPAFSPELISPILERMTDGFMNSTLGLLAKEAQWRQSEYGFATRWTIKSSEEPFTRDIIVSGQMDLVFDTGEKVIVVDYKTDRLEAPEEHADQLAVYRKAASALRGKPSETWLFYLRTNTATRVGN